MTKYIILYAATWLVNISIWCKKLSSILIIKKFIFLDLRILSPQHINIRFWLHWFRIICIFLSLWFFQKLLFSIQSLKMPNWNTLVTRYKFPAWLSSYINRMAVRLTNYLKRAANTMDNFSRFPCKIERLSFVLLRIVYLEYWVSNTLMPLLVVAFENRLNANLVGDARTFKNVVVVLLASKTPKWVMHIVHYKLSL